MKSVIENVELANPCADEMINVTVHTRGLSGDYLIVRREQKNHHMPVGLYAAAAVPGAGRYVNMQHQHIQNLIEYYENKWGRKYVAIKVPEGVEGCGSFVIRFPAGVFRSMEEKWC